ncbi:MAG TPA: peptide synthase [Planctomycetes bacterium]|mgnify:FL=1|nr:peptide synthase [Planctomycetota bacterium]
MTTDHEKRNPEAGVSRRLRQHAFERPQQVAVRELMSGRWQERTFKELDALVDRTAHALVRNGITRGMRTVLMVPPGREFLACTFALLRIGAPPVMVDPGMGISGLGECLNNAKPEAFIGIPKAHLGRVLLGWSRSTIRHRFTVGPGPRLPFVKDLEKLRTSVEDSVPFSGPVLGHHELAAVLFTSGSTGPAKGAMAHHGQLEAQVDALAQCHGLQAGEVDLPTFPLFGLFSVALGMTSTVPQMDFTRPADANPDHLLELIKTFSVTNLFASPALLGNLSTHLEEKEMKLEGLTRIISAGAPARHGAISALSKRVSMNTKIETPYGATEGLPLCHISHTGILETEQETQSGKGVCIGKSVPGIELQIHSPNDQPNCSPLPEETAGEIWVTGPSVSLEYLFDELSNLQHKFTDETGRIWHKTGDIGLRDSNSRIWFRGRASQRIQTATGILDTVAIERIFEVHPLVYRTALVGLGTKGQQIPVLCVEPNSDFNDEKKTLISDLQAMSQKNPLTDSITHIIITGPFPVDIRHNAKIQREKLALIAGKALS